MKIFGKRASILLWSIFLLTFMAFSFLYISNSISSLISGNNGIKKEDRKYEFLANTGNINDIDNGEIYTYFPTNFYTGVLRNGESITYTGITSQISFSVVPGGGAGFIYYSGSTSTGTTNLSFISNDTGDLYIENLAGFVNYTISSRNSFSAPKSKYMISKEIGGKTFIKNIGEK